MMLKSIGVILMCGAVCAGVGGFAGLNLPTLEWGFELSRNVKAFGELGWGESKLVFPWFGWVLTVLAFVLGLSILIKFSREGALTPITLRKIERFKSIKRGYYSFLILLGLAGVAALDHALVGSEALVVRHGFHQHLQYFYMHQVLSTVLAGARCPDQLSTVDAFHGTGVHACSAVSISIRITLPVSVCLVRYYSE